jgi:hypothetical protein
MAGIDEQEYQIANAIPGEIRCEEAQKSWLPKVIRDRKKFHQV